MPFATADRKEGCGKRPRIQRLMRMGGNQLYGCAYQKKEESNPICGGSMDARPFRIDFRVNGVHVGGEDKEQGASSVVRILQPLVQTVERKTSSVSLFRHAGQYSGMIFGFQTAHVFDESGKPFILCDGEQHSFRLVVLEYEYFPAMFGLLPACPVILDHVGIRYDCFCRNIHLFSLPSHGDKHTLFF